MGSLQLEISRGKNHLKIMIAKIALVSMLAAVALAAPEPQFPLGYGLGGGVVESVAPDCVPSTEEIEIQSCAPRAENVCSTADVVSEEITYERDAKRLSTNTADILPTPVLLSSVKPRLRLMLLSPFSMLVSPMLDMSVMLASLPSPTTPLPSPPLSPRPSKLPALRSKPNIALMSPSPLRRLPL